MSNDEESKDVLTKANKRKAARLKEVLSKTNKKRVAALRQVMTRYETQAEVARLLDWTPSYLSQMVGPTPSRAISEKTARQIEQGLKLKDGLLDREVHQPVVESVSAGDLLDNVMLTLDSALHALKWKPDATKYRGLVTYVHGNALKRGENQVDRAEVDALLKLVR